MLCSELCGHCSLTKAPLSLLTEQLAMLYKPALLLPKQYKTHTILQVSQYVGK